MFQTSCLVTSSTPRQFDSLQYQSSNLDHEISVKICPPFTNSSQVNVPSWFISMDEKISLARILGSPDGLLPIPSNILYRDWKVFIIFFSFFSLFYRHHINHLVLINLSRIVFIIYLKCPPVFVFFSIQWWQKQKMQLTLASALLFWLREEEELGEILWSLDNRWSHCPDNWKKF